MHTEHIDEERALRIDYAIQRDCEYYEAREWLRRNMRLEDVGTPPVGEGDVGAEAGYYAHLAGN